MEFVRHGWTVDFINEFCLGGIPAIAERLRMGNEDNLSGQVLAALLKPFDACSNVLTPEAIKKLSPIVDSALQFIETLKLTDMSGKEYESISDVLSSMKKLYADASEGEILARIDQFRLKVAQELMVSKTFNSKMNGLKEVGKLCEEASDVTQGWLDANRMLEWLQQNKIVQNVLRGSLHNGGYVTLVEVIIQFLVQHKALTNEELKAIWDSQIGQYTAVIRNVHDMLGRLASSFSPEHLSHLFECFKHSWADQTSQKTMSEMLEFITKLAKDDRQGTMAFQVAEFLWDIVKNPECSKVMVPLPLKSIEDILDGQKFSGEPLDKALWMKNCVASIKAEQAIVPALMLIEQLSESCSNYAAYHMDSDREKKLRELYTEHPSIVFDLAESCTKCCNRTRQALAGAGTSVAEQAQAKEKCYGMYSHAEVLKRHLQLLKYLLKQSALPDSHLDSQSCTKMWELVENPVVEEDLEILFQWFGGLVQGQSANRDCAMEADVQLELLTKMFPKMDIHLLQRPAFFFFQGLFISVNESKGKINCVRRSNDEHLRITTFDTDLIGLDFLWRVALETPNTAIAESAIKLLKACFVSTDEENARPLLFVEECFKRLCDVVNRISSPIVATEADEDASTTSDVSSSLQDDASDDAAVQAKAPKLDIDRMSPEVLVLQTNCDPARLVYVRTIERCLLLIENHVTAKDEELYNNDAPRVRLPHYRACRGDSISVKVKDDYAPVALVVKAHTNQPLAILRAMLAEHKRCAEQKCKLKVNGSLLQNLWQSPLGHKAVNIREGTIVTTVVQQYNNYQYNSNLPLKTLDTDETIEAGEIELALPGVLLVDNDTYVKLLFFLANQHNPQIHQRARAVLDLLPTAPTSCQALSNACVGAFQTLSAEPQELQDGDAAQTPTGSFEKLKGLFGLQKTTTFHLHYRLQVLVNRIIPATRAFTGFVRTFRRDFVAVGGLKLLFESLRWMPATPILEATDHAARKKAFVDALRLIHEFIAISVTEESPDIRPHRADSVDTLDFSLRNPAESDFSKDYDSDNEDAATTSDTSTLTTLPEHRVSAACFDEDQDVLPALVNSSLSECKLDSVILDVFHLAWAGGTGALDCGCISSDDLRQYTPQRPTSASDEAIQIMRQCVRLLKTLLVRSPASAHAILSLPDISKAVVDLLVACPSELARIEFAKLFLVLARTQAGPAASDPDPVLDGVNTNIELCVDILLKAELPLWRIPGKEDIESTRRYSQQCREYFKLCAELVPNLVRSKGSGVVALQQQITSEVEWLLQLTPSSEGQDCPQNDNTLLQTLMTGHMIYLRALLSCCSPEMKSSIGDQVVLFMVDVLLFPASRQRAKISSTTVFIAMCATTESRLAALAVMVELSRLCPTNARAIADALVRSQNLEDETKGEWDFEPILEPRSECGFVGLQNAGATCYMNSVIQQLYSHKQSRKHIFSLNDEEETRHQERELEKNAALSAGKDADKDADKDKDKKEGMSKTQQEGLEDVGSSSMFYQFQRIFGYLSESKSQYFKPGGFWQTYKNASNAPVDLRRHEDAVDFFQNLTDRLDSHLAAAGKDKGLEKTYGGMMADQKICRDPCNHYYETTQSFVNLEVDVRNNRNLHESLDQLVSGDELSGDNAYHCADCDKKVTALKRTCIKTLPQVLVIQLKRFDFDWENMRPVKSNDRFEFPLELDMEPWTVSGLTRRDKINQASITPSPTDGALPSGDEQERVDNSNDDNGDDGGDGGRPMRQASEPPTDRQSEGSTHYRIAGIVVHSGTATAGHYYSFVRARGKSGEPEGDRWYKFDDKSVTQWFRSDEEMEKQFYGGEYTPEGMYTTSDRSWSAYMLFYEKIEHANQGVVKHIPVSLAPDTIQSDIHEANVTFMHQRSTFDAAYFTFLHDYVKSQLGCIDADTSILTVRLATNFVFNTYLRTNENLRSTSAMCPMLEQFLANQSVACEWFLDEIGHSPRWLRAVLVECKLPEIRKSTMGLILTAMITLAENAKTAPDKLGPLERAAESLFAIVHNEAESNIREHWEHIHELFLLFSNYVDLGIQQRKHCMRAHLFRTGTKFLGIADEFPQIGVVASTLTKPAWQFHQQKGFRGLKSALCKLIRACDLSACETRLEGVNPQPNPFSLCSEAAPRLLQLPEEIRSMIFADAPSTFLLDVVLQSLGLPEVRRLCCCCSWNNLPFTTFIVSSILDKLPGNGRQLFELLSDMVKMTDDYQAQRVALIIGGKQDAAGRHSGLLKLIETNIAVHEKRAYLYIKFCVNLCNDNLEVANILGCSAVWAAAVSWLSDKVAGS